jgi:hypothetical protein
MKLLALSLLALTIGLSACDTTDTGDPATDRANTQANREKDACFAQADMIANQQGADAGSAKLEDCVNQYARDLQVAP